MATGIEYKGTSGKHDFKPRTSILNFKWKPTTITSYVTFGEGSNYNILPNTDHWDYSKLEGLAFSLWSNKRNSVLFGWCYDPERQKYRVVGYINEKGKHKRTPYIEVDQEQQIELKATMKDGVVYFDLNGTKFELKVGFKFTLGRKIGMWFGGNEPCPQDMTVWSMMLVN